MLWNIKIAQYRYRGCASAASATCCCAFAVANVSATTANAAEYPDRPLRIVVPFTAGGSTDVLARMLGKQLTTAWGQPVVIDNRAGANGVIAAELIAKSNPDGHSLLMVAIGHAVNPSLQKKLPYDTAKDFQPVSLTAILPQLLAVHPSLKANSVKELIALARSNTKPLNYASGGVGASQHLAGELFNALAAVRMSHVPYKGGGPALVELLAGQINVMITTTLSVAPHGRTGKLRVLGISTTKRSALWPETPTIAEAGVPGYESNAWYGLVGPAGLPPAVLDKLSAEVMKSTKSKDMADALIKQGAEPMGNGPKEFTAFIKAETEKYAKVIHAAGIKPD